MKKIINKISKAFLLILISQACESCDLMKDIKSINTIEEYKECMKKEVSVILYFKPECPHCKTIAPIINKVYEKYKGNKRVIIKKINLSDNITYDLALLNNIETVPTVLISRYNSLIKRYDASNSSERTEANIISNIEIALNPPAEEPEVEQSTMILQT